MSRETANGNADYNDLVASTPKKIRPFTIKQLTILQNMKAGWILKRHILTFEYFLCQKNQKIKQNRSSCKKLIKDIAIIKSEEDKQFHTFRLTKFGESLCL